MLKRIVKKIAPPHTRIGRKLKITAASIGLAKPLHFNVEYKHWIDHVEYEMFLPVVGYAKESNPLFSIIIPFFNTPNKYLQPLMNSILGQSYGNWELIIADASTNKTRARVIKKMAERDKRLKYHKLENNDGISNNTNGALEFATGTYVIFSDHDDVLSPHALNEMAARILADDSIDILYSDEDKLSDDGKWRHSPYFKPDWSPHLFLYTNYTNHLSAIRRTLVTGVGGLRKECDGSQDYDLLLRVHGSSTTPLNVAHIPKILYHWREAAGSTAVDYKRKAYAFEAGKKGLSDYLKAKNIHGTVESIKETPGFYREILQPNTFKRAHIVVDLGSSKILNEGVKEKLKSATKTKLEISFYCGKSEFDEQNTDLNDERDVVVMIRDYVLPKESDWLDRLVGVLELSDVAAVSPRVLTADGQRIVDMGLVRTRSGELMKLHFRNGEKDLTINGGARWVRDVDELTGMICVYRPNQGIQRLKGQYFVVWSHVDVIRYPINEQSTYFNDNLRILDDGRVTVNE